MFNKKKKRIEELETEINDLKILNSELMRKNENLAAKLSVEHIRSPYCGKCKNGIPYGPFEEYACLLECRCKDFERNSPSFS